MVTALLSGASSHANHSRNVRVEVQADLDPPGVRIELAGAPGWLFLSLDSDLDAVVAALNKGASGILTMASAAEDVERALEVIEDGGTGYLPLEVLRRMTSADAEDRSDAESRSDYTLTDRELQVLSQLAQGCSNLDIAEALGISYHTVRSHMRSLATKLGTNSRSAIEAKAKLVLSGSPRRPTT
jgi:DNA-binding NarL/FixJ family response regulator